MAAHLRQRGIGLSLIVLLIAAVTSAGRAEPGSAAPTPAADAVSFKDMAETRDLGDDTLSPGGKYAAYVVTTPDVTTNTSREELYLATTDGRQIRRLETPPGSSPASVQWFPDGQRFAFLLQEGGKAQIHLGDAAAGTVKAITRLDGGVDEYAISTDGRSVALIASAASGRQVWTLDPAGNAEPVPLTTALTAPASLRWHPNGKRLFYVQDDAATAGGEAPRPTPSVVRWKDAPRPPRHIHAVDIATRQERSWTEGTDFTVLNFEIAPDGKHLAFQTNVTARAILAADEDRATLRLMNLDSSTVRVLVPSLGGPRTCSYVFSPDGRTIAFTAPDRFEYGRNGRISTVDLASGRLRTWKEPADLSVPAVFWNESSDRLYFTLRDGLCSPWRELRLADGSSSRITGDGACFGRYVPAAKAFLFVHTTGQQPGELFTTTAANLGDRARWVQLSRANERLAALPKVTTETIRWQSRDGREIEGVLYKPLGYRQGERYPMIVQGNGAYDLYCSFYQSYAPLLASRGYLVLMVNHRGLGTTRYGEAFRREAIYPSEPLELGAQDIISGVEHLVRTGFADPQRLGYMGWSVGGGMADWLMTRTQMFRAISSGAGGGDLVAAYGQIEQYRHFYRLSRGGSAFRYWDRYADCSAVRFMDRAKTPTLIQVGENDDGVLLQCRQMYNALRDFDVPVEMLIHAGQPHILQTPQSILAKMLAEYAWFDQWLRGGPSWLTWQDRYEEIVGGK